jgi:IclR family acetate operon transcriptional repressor
VAVAGAPRKRTNYESDGGSVRRALRLMDAVSTHHPRPVGLRTVAESTGLTKATAFRLLSVLVEENILAFHPDTRAYTLGSRLAAIGARQLARDPVRRAAEEAMRALWQSSGETVTLSVRQGFERVYVDQIESPQAVRFTVELGSRQPLHAGASGRAMLAWLGPDEVEAYIARGLPALTGATITDPEALRRALADTRASGFALSHAERVAGVISVASPILDATGEPVGAISVCTPDNRATIASCAALGGDVAAAARAASRLLGYVPEE